MINTYLCTSDNHQVQLLAKDVDMARDYFIKLHGEDGNIEVYDTKGLFN